MAKSAPDTKVEDVLSSVRRLVSDELPRNERPALPEGQDALVLTDAHRIESNGAEHIAGRTLEERIAELEVAVGDTANDDEFEPDGSEDQAMHRPDRIVYTRPPEPEEADEMRRNTLRLSQIALIDTGPESDPSDEGSDTQLQFRREQTAGDASDEAPMAEDVKETLTAAEVHVFSSPDDEVARIEARLNGDLEPEPKPRTEPAKMDFVPDREHEEVEAEPATDAHEELDLQEPEELELEEVAQEAEPQRGPADVLHLRPEASEAAFDADLEAAISSVEEPQDVFEESSAAEDTIAEAAIGMAVGEVLDEDALRPMVAKLIREELQGDLGERITRNVRKLVRREILRALAARDAE